MPTINDANGTPAGVNVEGHLETHSIVEAEALHVNEDHDSSYSVIFEADPGGTDIDFFYLKNNDPRDLIIYKIRMSTGTLDVDVDIKLGVTGTPTSGTTVTPGNMKAGSGGVAKVTCEYRDADLALTGGTIVDTLYIDKDFVGEQEFDYPGGIILPENQTMIFNCVGTDPTADINTVLFFYYHE